MLSLPPTAFLPRRFLTSQERSTFIEQRDRLFARCTPDEQVCLIAFAQWFAEQRHQFLKTPNVFSESFVACLHYRHVPLLYVRPGINVRSLDRIARAINHVDTWLERRLQRRVIAHLEALPLRGQEEVRMGVANYLRTLPLQLPWGSQRELEKALDQVVSKFAKDRSTNPITRVKGLIHAMQAMPDRENAHRLGF